jgi:hypothetical protein
MEGEMKSLRIFTGLLILSFFVITGSGIRAENLITIKSLHGKVINSVTKQPVQDAFIKVVNSNSGGGVLYSTRVRSGHYEFKNITVPETDGIKIMLYANDDYDRPFPGNEAESDGIKIMLYANDDYDGPAGGFAYGVTLNFANITDGLYKLDLLADGSTLPVNFSLNQNYPNPFNPATTISFVLPFSSGVTLKIYDMHGKEVASIYENKNVEAGYNEVQFNAQSLSSGVYFYSLTAENFSSIKKMTLVK